MPYVVKVENGKAKLYDKGSFKRSVGSNVSAADCDEEYVVIVEKGKVKQYTTGGSFKRSIGESNAVGVSINGQSIVIAYANGKAKEYKASNGSFVRSY